MAGYGNKIAPSTEIPEHDTRFGSAQDTQAYSGATDYGSGITGGAGSGNKMSNSTSHDQKDSTTGKLMEKAGNMLHEDGMAEKGRAKREEAGLTSDDTSY